METSIQPIVSDQITYGDRLFRMLVLFCCVAAPLLWIYQQAGGIAFYSYAPLFILLCVGLVYRLRNAQPLLIWMLYLSIYFAYLLPLFYGGAHLSQYSTYHRIELFDQVGFQFFVFYLGLGIGALTFVNPAGRCLRNMAYPEVSGVNLTLFMGLLALLVYKTTQTGVNVLMADNPYEAYTENLEATSAVALFAVLALSMGLCVTRAGWIRKFVFGGFALVLLYVYVTHGHRIVLSTLVMAIFVFFFELRFRTRTLMIGFLLAAMLFLWLNQLKNGMDFDAAAMISEGNGEYIRSHHADNLYGSACINGVIAEGRYTWFDRGALFVGSLLQAAVPASFFPSRMRFPHFVWNYTVYGGGGLAPVACWTMGGWLLTLLFPAGLVRIAARAYRENSSPWLRVAFMAACVFCCDWTSYDFHVVIRFPLYAVVGIYLLSELDVRSLLTSRYCRLIQKQSL